MVAAFVSFPFDVTEERRNEARAVFEKVAMEEANLRRQVAGLEGEVHQLRSMQALKGKEDSDAPLEVHRLRAALRREQAVRDEVQQQLDALKRSSATMEAYGTGSVGAMRDVARGGVSPRQGGEQRAAAEDQARKQMARARSLEVMAGEKERECARLRHETATLRDDVRALHEEMDEAEAAAEAMAQQHERDTSLLRQRLRLCENDVAMAEEELRRVQGRYSVLAALVHERGISRYVAQAGDVGLEALVADAHQGVHVDMLWEELHLVGLERDELEAGLLDVTAHLSRECQVRPGCPPPRPSRHLPAAWR
jgi:predicted  nucleic acid-binding Zn-ribbon protein